MKFDWFKETKNLKQVVYGFSDSNTDTNGYSRLQYLASYDPNSNEVMENVMKSDGSTEDWIKYNHMNDQYIIDNLDTLSNEIIVRQAVSEETWERVQHRKFELYLIDCTYDAGEFFHSLSMKRVFRSFALSVNHTLDSIDEQE